MTSTQTLNTNSAGSLSSLLGLHGCTLLTAQEKIDGQLPDPIKDHLLRSRVFRFLVWAQIVPALSIAIDLLYFNNASESADILILGSFGLFTAFSMAWLPFCYICSCTLSKKLR